MRTLSVDPDNDIFVGPSGALSVSTALEAVLQACAHAAKAQLGEMMFAVDEGLPNFAVVWNGAPNLNQFDAYLRRTLSQVEGVTSVEDVEVEAAAGVVTYRATIRTIYGLGALNG